MQGFEIEALHNNYAKALALAFSKILATNDSSMFLIR